MKNGIRNRCGNGFFCAVFPRLPPVPVPWRARSPPAGWRQCARGLPPSPGGQGSGFRFRTEAHGDVPGCRSGAFLGVRIFRNAGGNFPGFVRNGFRVAHRNGHVGVGNVRSRCGFLLCLLAARQCAGAGDGQFQVGIRQSSAADGGIVTLAGLRCASQPGIGPCEVEMGFGGFRMDLQRFFKMVNRLFVIPGRCFPGCPGKAGPERWLGSA